jgi:hypothetical protein
MATQAQIGFAFFLGPPFFHVAAGQGRNITAFVQRSKSFSGTINVEVVNPPNWVTYVPVTIGPASSNGTLYVIASKDAPKGEANLTVRASSPGAADQIALLDMKIVGIYNVVEKSGSAVVYNTTKILDADSLKALTSYANDTGNFIFSAETPQLQGLARGDVIIVPPKRTQLLKSGLMRTVLSLTHQGSGVVVQTIRASLFDELQELNIGNSGGNFSYSASQFPLFSIPTVYIPDIWEYDWHTLFDSQFTTNGPVEIGGGDTFSATGHFAVALYAGIHFTWSNGLDYFAIHLGFVLDEQASLSGNNGTTLDWGNSEPANLGTIFDNTIPILDDLVWVTIQANWEGRASGPLNQNINLNINTKAGYEVGPTYDTKDGCSPCGWFMFSNPTGPTADHTVNSVTVGTGGSQAKVEIGPKLQVAINGGLDGLISGSLWGAISADFYLQLNSLIPRPPSSWWVTWGVDAYAGIGAGLSVLWGLYSWESSLETWSLGNLLGPSILFEGTTFPPIVSITNPQPGQVVNVGVGIMAPLTFKATAIDPQDGDLCTASGVTLVWTDEQGKIGTGCNLVNAVFQNNGEYHVVFTATDAEGRTASSQPVVVSATYGKPYVYIVVPTSTETKPYYVGDSLDLEGGGSLGFKDLPCTSLLFRVYSDSGFKFSAVPVQTMSGSPVCHSPIQFTTAGLWKITLTVASPGVPSVTVERDVTVKALPPNPPPYVNVTPPTSYIGDYTSQITVIGRIGSRSLNGKVGKFVWLEHDKQMVISGITVGGDLSNYPGGCPITQNSMGCLVDVTFTASQYCTAPKQLTNVTITLTAYEQYGSKTVHNSDSINLSLQCTVVTAPPPIALLWASWGGILPERWSKSRSGIKGRLARSLLRLRAIVR